MTRNQPSKNKMQYSGMKASETSTELDLFFENIFNSKESLKDLNKMVLLFIDKKISEGREDFIVSLLEDERLLKFSHPSLLKSILLITEGLRDVGRINHSRQKIESKMNQLLLKY